MQSECGLSPSLAAPHTPSSMPDCLVAAEQAWHFSLHSELQQTPSMQKPVVHWLPVVHAPPAAFLVLHWPGAVEVSQYLYVIEGGKVRREGPQADFADHLRDLIRDSLLGA